ncbi:multicopper oxidase family protein [Methylovirgula sp. 4M-Z18]|uniref:multicopper oxidase family protein n=1 Tax=Methylovirgula sp. 4M-Z18 TaxID=2293567 RepID=UPI000E2FD012|nr:multicopper oxidase family protein [Methylovirgula sp. 4M-Z18]RFB80465.1 multicopper oxidase family protein [Methylovirgula sp. 4M-Z18]
MSKLPSLDRRGFILGASMSLFAVTGRAQQSDDGFTRLTARPRDLSTPDPQILARPFGYAGHLPYPILRVRQGDDVRVRLTNALDRSTSLHWRGVRLPNAMDGAAGLTQKPVALGETFEYRFRAADSGTFCFHPLISGMTSDQIDKGLKGLLIVDEAIPPDRDAEAILICDQRPGATAVTVNGRTSPHLDTVRPGTRLRLRIANVSSQNIMLASFSGAQPLLIAIDGRPSALFEPSRQTLPMGPMARFDIMLDMPQEDGAKVRLTLYHDEGPKGPSGDGDPNQVLAEWTAQGAPVAARPPIAKLPDNPALPAAIPLENALKFEFAVAKDRMWSLNGASWTGTPGKPLFSAARGRPISIGFANHSDEAIDLALHGHHCRLLHPMDDGWEPYWRDSILIPPRQTQHVAFVAGEPGKWMIHDAILPHFDQGLAGWFEVT